MPVLEAESYYWLWSRDLAWGYYDHPPGVAVTMLWSRLVGSSPLGLRLGHILLGTLGSWLAFLLYRRLVSPTAALASLLALSFAPFWFPFMVAATPDGPLLFCWSLALLLFHTAWSRESLPLSVAAGIGAGLAILCKYNGALLLPAFFLFLLPDPKRLLLRPHPYVGVAAALLVWAPNLLWSSGHGSTSLARPLSGGLEPLAAPKHLAVLALQPLVLLTPLLAWAWVRQTWIGMRTGRWADPSFRLAVSASWVPFAAFGVVALVTEIHLQWTVICFVTALPIALENLGRVGAGVTPRFLRTALVSGAVLVVSLAVLTPLTLARVRHDGEEKPRGLVRLAVETRGWDELRKRMASEIDARAEGPVFLTAPNYHLVGQLEWLAGGRHTSQPLDRGRLKQYSVWQRDGELVGWDALYVSKRHREKDEELLRRSCGTVDELDPVTVDVGAEVTRFVLFWCHGFKGLQ